MPEGVKLSLIFLILFEKMRQTGQPMTFQTHGMEVSHQRPCSGFLFRLDEGSILKSEWSDMLMWWYLLY